MIQGHKRRRRRRKERKETRTLHLFQSNIWMHLSLCFRAVYLCRDARSTSSQRIQTNQEDTFLRLYQVSSLLASSLPPLPPPHISPETTLPLRRVYIRIIVFILFLVGHFRFWVLAVHPHKYDVYAPLVAIACTTFSLLFLFHLFSLYSHRACLVQYLLIKILKWKH